MGDEGVFGVGELADRFYQRDVCVFEAAGELPGGFVVGFKVRSEGDVVGVANVEDLGMLKGVGNGRRRAYYDIGDIGVEEPGVLEVC